MSDQKPNGTNWLPLKIPNLSSLPMGLRAFLAFLVILFGIAAVSYFVALSVELGLAIFVERKFEDARNIALILAALIGAPFVIWRVWTIHRQTNINEESHHADLFTKAVEQLGADKDERFKDDKDEWQHRTVKNTEVRLGGIYALERLSHVSPAFHWSIMEVLTAYIRENSPAPELRKNEKGELEYQESPVIVIDIQAAVTVIGRRRPEDVKRSLTHNQRLDLRRVNLIGAVLRGADLRRAELRGADLKRADLGISNLGKADLKRADLTHADLNFASLIGADLIGADLTHAKLSAANLDEAKITQDQLDTAHR